MAVVLQGGFSHPAPAGSWEEQDTVSTVKAITGKRKSIGVCLVLVHFFNLS